MQLHLHAAEQGKQSIMDVLFWSSVLQLSLEDLQVLPYQLENIVSHPVILIFSLKFNNCLWAHASVYWLSPGKEAQSEKEACSCGLASYIKGGAWCKCLHLQRTGVEECYLLFNTTSWSQQISPISG